MPVDKFTTLRTPIKDTPKSVERNSKTSPRSDLQALEAEYLRRKELRETKRMMNEVREAAKEPVTETCMECQDRRKSEPSWARLTPYEKAYETPRSLLLLLEEERTRCLQLESHNHMLTKEIQSQKQSNEKAIKRMEEDHKEEMKNIQREMNEKKEDNTRLARKLSSATTKHADDVLVWSSRTEKLDSLLAKANASLQQSEIKALRLEKEAIDIQSNHTRLLDKLTVRDKDVQSIHDNLQQREKEILREKDTRVKLERQLLELESTLGCKTQELMNARNEAQCLQAEVNSIRPSLEHLKQDLEQNNNKEREKSTQINQLKCEIETLRALCDELKSDCEKAKAGEKRALGEHESDVAQLHADIERSRSRECDLRAQCENLKSSEKRFQQEIEILLDRQSSSMKEISSLSKQERKFTVALSTSQAECNHLKTQNQELAARLSDLRRALHDSNARLENTKSERSSFDTEVVSLKQETSRLKNEVNNLNSLLEREKSMVTEIKSILKEKTHALNEKSSRISNLEKALADFKSSLRHKHVHSEQISAEYQEKIKLATETISRLNERVNLLEKTLVDVEVDAQKHKELESQLHDAFNERDEKISALSAQLTCVDANNAHLLDEIREDLRVKELECTQLHENCALFERQLRDVHDQRENTDQVIAKLRLDVQGRDHSIALLKMELEAAQKSITRLKQDEVYNLKYSPKQKPTRISIDEQRTTISGLDDYDELFMRKNSTTPVPYRKTPSLIPRIIEKSEQKI